VAYLELLVLLEPAESLALAVSLAPAVLSEQAVSLVLVD
jgi:hypothetical protein